MRMHWQALMEDSPTKKRKKKRRKKVTTDPWQDETAVCHLCLWEIELYGLPYFMLCKYGRNTDINTEYGLYVYSARCSY